MPVEKVKEAIEQEEKELLFGKRGAKKAESDVGRQTETKTESGPPPMV